ncbi:MAG: hypothetical protein K2Y40_04740 [Reyranella sp.]|nr:hypothetical protein [Reyranella sp.]
MKFRFGVTAVSALLLWLGAPGVQAADIEVRVAAAPGVTPLIRLSGPFRQGDAEAMRQLLGRLKNQTRPSPGTPLATVELSSLGGDLTEGLKIGYLFRDHNVATVVRRKDICLSACALAFLGGTAAHGSADPTDRTPSHHLEIGGKLGFHAFYLNPNSAQAPTATDPVQGRRQGFVEARAASTAVMFYAAELGIDARFVAAMMTKPQDEFAYVTTTADFLTLKVCPIGLARPALSPAEQALNICNHATGWADPAGPAQVRSMTARQARRYLLETLQQNMLSLETKGALSRQLASYPVMRDERAIDDLYADLRAAGVRLPKIVGPVFEVSGYRSGGEAQCFVSLSLEDPDRYAVAIRRPGKWSHPQWSAPADCRGLHLHDRDAAINPRP